MPDWIDPRSLLDGDHLEHRGRRHRIRGWHQEMIIDRQIRRQGLSGLQLSSPDRSAANLAEFAIESRARSDVPGFGCCRDQRTLRSSTKPKKALLASAWRSLGLIHDNRPWRLLHQPTSLLKSATGASFQVGWNSELLSGSRVTPLCSRRDLQGRGQKMEQHQYGGRRPARKVIVSAGMTAQLSIQSHSPKRVPTGSAITTNWLITNCLTSGSTFVLMGLRKARRAFPSPSWVSLLSVDDKSGLDRARMVGGGAGFCPQVLVDYTPLSPQDRSFESTNA